MKSNFAMLNALKANFDQLYCQDDPRAYYTVLGELGYSIPDLAKPVITRLLKARQAHQPEKISVLDVGCSYGINAAMHRYPLTVNSLRNRYRCTPMDRVSASELIRLDSQFFASWTDASVARFIGLDKSRPAIEYSRAVKLIDHGIVADLEQCPLEREDARLLQGIDVILATSSIGYVTDETYRTILRALPRAPWVISFVLRIFPYEQIADTLSNFGLATERLAGRTFAQRRFQDEREFQWALQTLHGRGLDPTGLESSGFLQAELFVSRPANDIRTLPLSALLTRSSELPLPIGGR